MGNVHARLLATAIPEARLAGVADADPAARDRVAARWQVPTFATASELAAVPGVDAVLVAVSSSQHLPVVREVAAVARDILCEKPLALTLEDSEAAAEAARRAGVRLQVGLMRRWDPDYRAARDHLAAGRCGRPVVFSSLQYDPEPPPIAFCDPAVSGGIFVDMGIHEFDLGRWLLGDEVESVHALGSTRAVPELAAVGDVDSAVVDLRFASGAVGVVLLGRSAAYGEDVRTEVLGSDGSVFVGDLPVGKGRFARRGQVVSRTLDPGALRFERAYAEQARAFARAILDDRPVEVTAEDATAALRIALAADRSMREGRIVTIAEVG
jgi:predicted dehydrogenase